MKIIHTSDWHLGQTLYGHDRTEEQNAFLQQLADIVRQEQPDALVVSGDIFHTGTPSATVQKLYTDHLLQIRNACPTMTIVITAGNHDSASKLEIASKLWKHVGVHVVGQTERLTNGTIDLARQIIPVRATPDSPTKGFILAVPHIYPYNFPELQENTPREMRQQVFFEVLSDTAARMNTEQLPVVLMAHLCVTGSDQTGHNLSLGGMDSVGIETLGNGYDYLALGHIHCPQTLSSECGTARYCGTPVPVSFDEHYPHSVSLIDIAAHGSLPKISTIAINNPKPLLTIPKAPASIEEALDELRNLDYPTPAYIRLHVLAENFINPNAQEEASEIARKKGHHFCYIHLQRQESVQKTSGQTLTVEELRRTSPIDIAQMYYNDTHNGNLPDDFAAMIQEAWQQVTDEND